MAFPGGTEVKKLPGNAGYARDVDSIQSLGQEDPLEKAMATHSSILFFFLSLFFNLFLLVGG